MGRLTRTLLVLVAVIVIALAAWFGMGFFVAPATGPVKSQVREVSDFNTLKVDGRGTVVIRVGDKPTLRVKAKESVLERLQTHVDGQVLSLHERWGWMGVVFLFGDPKITYYVTVPTLSSIDLSGSIVIGTEGVLAADKLSIDTSGSSNVTISVNTSSLTLDCSGSSDVDLSGTVDNLVIEASGSTDVQARELVTRIATIDCSGSSDIHLNVSELLTVKMSGSSNVTYLGNPQLNTDLSGSGRVRAAQ